MARRTTENDARLGLELTRERLTRLELIKRGGLTALLAAGAPALLAACGGADTDEPAAAPAESTAPAASSTAPASSGSASEVGGNIDYLSWEGYDFPDDQIPTMKAWKEENGVTMTSSYIANNDEFVAKFKAGGTEGVDVTTYGQAFANYWSELGILAPIDSEKIPNLANLFPFFASDIDNFWVRPDGTRTGVPMFWGAVALLYDSAVIPTAPTSFDICFDPKYKGKVIVQDDPGSNFTSAAYHHGFTMDKLTPEQFDTLKTYLKTLLGQTKGIAPTVGDAANQLAAGEGVLMFSGWFAVASFAAAAGGKTIKTALPEAGGYTYVDSYAVLPGSDNLDTVYAFINQALTPEVNAEAATFLTGGVTVADAVALLPPEQTAAYSYDHLDAFFEKAPLFTIPPQESDEYVTYQEMIDAWAEIKAGA